VKEIERRLPELDGTLAGRREVREHRFRLGAGVGVRHAEPINVVRHLGLLAFVPLAADQRLTELVFGAYDESFERLPDCDWIVTMITTVYVIQINYYPN